MLFLHFPTSARGCISQPRASRSSQLITRVATPPSAEPRSPPFLFWVKANGVWGVVQDWSSSPTLNWNTTGLAPGNYMVEADARAGTSGIWQAYGQLPYTLSASNTCTSAAVSPSPASPQTA